MCHYLVVVINISLFIILFSGFLFFLFLFFFSSYAFLIVFLLLFLLLLLLFFTSFCFAARLCRFTHANLHDVVVSPPVPQKYF